MGNKQASWFIDESNISYNEADLLGSGEYGKVYKVAVAVKVLSNPARDKDNLQSSVQEIDILSQLRHPNILSFLGTHLVFIGVELIPAACCRASDGRLLIVTELLTGMSVSSLLAKSKQPVWRRLQMARETCLGMAWLHEKNVVHQDLKLENLLLDSAGVVKISDFGFAKLLQKTKKNRENKGTIFYMAPEAVANLPSDHRVDVYAFGICLWELMTHGRRVNDYIMQFADEETFRKEVVAGRRPPIEPSWSPGLRALLQACWAPNPGDRPPFAEILKRLDDVILDEVLQEAVAVKIWKKSIGLTDGGAPFVTTWKRFAKGLCEVWPEVRTKNVELLSVYGVLVRLEAKTGTRNDRDGVVTLPAFALLLKCFGLTRGKYSFVDDVHSAVCCLWFHGELQPGETERLLKRKNVGKFLVRIDTGEDGGFILSRVAPPKTGAGAAPGPASKNIILNKRIDRVAANGRAQYHLGKRSCDTLVELVNDVMSRKNLSVKKCEKFINLSESIVVEEDHTDLLGS